MDEESGDYEQSQSAADEAVSSSKAISHGTTDDDDTKNNDIRSRTLFLQTAFWITMWYSTSLATLFLNKIILSRKGSSVHVLGMCQMTTAAVLGGWTAYGGGEWIRCRLGDILPDSTLRTLLLSMTASGGGSTNHRSVGNSNGGLPKQQSSLDVNGSSSRDNNSKSSSVNYTFIRDMSIVGLLRGATVVLGLIALEHVPVSFVETIKATAPGKYFFDNKT
jgi:solute carrier family 35 protein E2